MSQTHIFNFFPGSIHRSRILKTLSLFARRQKNTYIPNQQAWLNKLYFQISNSKEKKCLTIDTRVVNKLGPGKFRTSADNREEQICYFNRNKSDTHFTYFSSKRVQTEPITFSLNLSIKASTLNLTVHCLMVELRDSFKKLVNKTLTMEDPRLTISQSQQIYDSGNEEDNEETLIENQPEENQGFSRQTENKIVNRHKIKYTATRIKYSPTRIKYTTSEKRGFETKRIETRS